MEQFDSWAEVYDELYARKKDDLDFYYKEAKNSRQPILELACGTGRIALKLADAGMKVVGLDISEQMLKKAKEKLVQIGKISGNIRLEQGDMRYFHLPEKFGLVIIPFRSFLCLLSPEDQESCLRCIHSHLKAEGKLIITIFNPDLKRLLADYKNPKLIHKYNNSKGNKVLVYEKSDYNLAKQLINTQAILREKDKSNKTISKSIYSLELRYIFRYEMQHLLEKCGFKIISLYGNYDYSEFTSKSSEMIWVAEKK